MPIANPTNTNYTGRTRDVSILQYPDATKVDAQTVLPSFGKVSRFCAGVQKLIQKYLIILFTNLDSQTYYPSFGTNLLYTLKAGISPVDSLAAAQIFNLASFEAVNTLKAYQATNETLATDEQLASAELTNITLIGGFVSFEVTLTTVAGEAIDFIVPLPK